MSIFTFDASHSLGKVRAVDTHRVDIQVNSDEDLRKARVGQLVVIALPGAIEEWLIGIIDKVTKTPVLEANDELGSEDEASLVSLRRESVLNSVRLTLVGTVGLTTDNKPRFSRSLVQVPEIDGTCNILRDAQLQAFMNLLSVEGKTDHSLEMGRYTIDESAIAYLDGNRLFQRHASLLGSTGSGKSWTVAAILEQASKLPSANLIVFDLHGEYRDLKYTRRLRIPGPEELGTADDRLLYLPYWLLNAEEIQAMFIDRSEFSAHNQVMAFQDTVVAEKKKTLTSLKKDEVLNAFTLDSPIPFSMDRVISKLKVLNEQMVPGAKAGTEKKGPFNGEFDRLIPRLESKISDKRYGFLFQSPESENQYGSMAAMMMRLMDYSQVHAQIKIIDFSEVPADILPIIVGLVARIIYQIQFWTDRDKRKPMAFVCDEAHLYLPKKEGKNPVEQRAIENFEKIAKEGRKYGVALLVVSQRPSDVSTTILSQCNNIISLRLTNSDDQNTVKKLMPESLEGLMDTLPILDIGEALVVGDAVLLPSRIRIHPPNEKPLSATIDFWDEWQKPPEAPDLGQAVENMRRQNRT